VRGEGGGGGEIFTDHKEKRIKLFIKLLRKPLVYFTVRQHAVGATQFLDKILASST